MRSIVLPVMLFGFIASAAAADNDMPDKLTFPAKTGNVVFSHKMHVDGGIKCKTCHDRKGGKIKGLGREWAHKVCRGCHEAILLGPDKCNGCHGS
ncbi:cytochrome c3 family protein [Geobacter sp. OR-1]|uniref:cytochrome c3 family protein n=1 Tax=Geobacter sp. OR-1 TaxID=1266765 RepID=UPI0005A88835|nr:cytochrome c3 family protein [Geobacter sp. OR-1]